MKKPKPTLYRLKYDGPDVERRLAVVRTQQGNPGAQDLCLPRHDAERIRDILVSLYGEEWILVEVGDE